MPEISMVTIVIAEISPDRESGTSQVAMKSMSRTNKKECFILTSTYRILVRLSGRLLVLSVNPEQNPLIGQRNGKKRRCQPEKESGPSPGAYVGIALALSGTEV